MTGMVDRRSGRCSLAKRLKFTGRIPVNLTILERFDFHLVNPCFPGSWLFGLIRGGRFLRLLNRFKDSSLERPARKCLQRITTIHKFNLHPVTQLNLRRVVLLGIDHVIQLVGVLRTRFRVEHALP